MRYKKDKEIGRGGSGAVFLATSEDQQLKLAWKEPLQGSTADQIKRFKREIRLQKQLDHKHIMPVVAHKLDRDPPMYFMPLATHSLRDVIDEYQKDRRAALKLFLEICDALSYAHLEGVIHRDIKPENIMFVNDVAKVSDFGIGREIDRTTTTITQDNMNMGTIAYMAPEQLISFRDVDERSDIYSLGKLLYELLSGEFPIVIESRKLDCGYRYIVEKAIRSSPKDRFYSVNEFVKEITLLSEEPEMFIPELTVAKQLIQQAASSGFDRDLESAIRYLISRVNNEELYRQVVVDLPMHILEWGGQFMSDETCDVVDAFCQHVDQGLTFTAVDSVADFLRAAFFVCQRGSTKEHILSRLFEMGYDYNRYYVRKVVSDVLELADSEGDILILRRVISKFGNKISWYESSFTSSTPRLLTDAYTSAKSNLNRSE